MSKIKYPWWPYARNCICWYKRKSNCLSEEELHAVEMALMDIDKLPDAKQRRVIVDQVLLNNYMTLDGAADKAHVSYSTARRYHQHAIKQVAYHLGRLK